jgi:hypothetical protein
LGEVEEVVADGVLRREVREEIEVEEVEVEKVGVEEGGEREEKEDEMERK